MKKILFLLLFIPLSLSLFSQGVDYKYNAKHITGIKQSTIYVIPTKDQAFNDSLNYYMEKFWKATPYKIISREEADALLKEESNYFLASVNALGNNGYGQNSTVISPKEDNASSVFVFHGSRKSKLKNIEYQDALFCRLPFYGVENYLAGVGYMIKNLNDNIELLIKLQEANKITEVNSPSKPWIPLMRTEFSKRAGVLKGKTLLIDESTMKRNLNEKVLSAYKYSYKIVPTAELLNLVKTDPKKYCFLAANTDMDIYDAESKELIFSVETLTGSGMNKITEKHIQSLNKFIGQ
jgi:hypothetical protein